MASLDMKGPFTFDAPTINQVIHDNKIGNYALGSKNEKGGLNASYVGRSDTDVKIELHARLQTHKHPHFKCSYANSVKEAYEKECKNYHDFGPDNLENEIHPAAPDGSNLRCPICGN